MCELQTISGGHNFFIQSFFSCRISVYGLALNLTIARMFFFLRFGFISYPSYEEAKEALNLTVEIDGRVLNLGLPNRILKNKCMLLSLSYCAWVDTQHTHTVEHKYTRDGEHQIIYTVELQLSQQQINELFGRPYIHFKIQGSSVKYCNRTYTCTQNALIEQSFSNFG